MPTLPTDMAKWLRRRQEESGVFSFEWDKFRNRWIFGLIWRRDGKVWWAIYQSADLLSFSAVLPAMQTSTTTTASKQPLRLRCTDHSVGHEMFATSSGNNIFPNMIYNFGTQSASKSPTRWQLLPDGCR